MPIAEADIALRYSRRTAPAGYVQAGTAALSTGAYVSTTRIIDATLNNLFDEITSEENASKADEYRCFFVHNTHPTLTLYNVKVWIVTEIIGGADHGIAVDTVGPSPATAVVKQASEVLNDSWQPTATDHTLGYGYGDLPLGEGLYGGWSELFFTTPHTKAQALVIGDLPADHVRAVWVKRVAQATAAVPNDGVTLRIEGETTA